MMNYLWLIQDYMKTIYNLKLLKIPYITLLEYFRKELVNTSKSWCNLIVF
jgi:hypothetical protein